MSEKTMQHTAKKFNWKLLWSLLVVPLLLFGYNWYLEKTDFPVTPDLITEAEFQEILDGALALRLGDGVFSLPRMDGLVEVASDWDAKVRPWDVNGDGKPDFHIRLEHYAKGSVADGHFDADSRVARAHFLDVLFKGERFGILDETMWVESDEGLLSITLFRPEKQDHSGFRPLIEAMLEEVRKNP